MSFENSGAGTLAYETCRYGNSRLMFRGPRHSLDTPYCAVVGGSETYGKFVPQPFTSLIEDEIGLPMVNLGCVNAGLDVFVNDVAVMDVVAGAKVSVIQALGAHNMSNRFYIVHPRRNDRFLRASAMLKALYPNVDFTEFHFTRHLLTELESRSAAAFEVVVAELQMAWQARMRKLATQIPGAKVLLWLSIPSGASDGDCGDMASEPLFVTRHMIETVRPYFTKIVEVEPSSAAMLSGTAGMVHSELEEPAAAALPGPAIHREVADALGPVLQEVAAG